MRLCSPHSTIRNARRSPTSLSIDVNGGALAISDQELARVDRWWRAANYCAVGQIYLCANPLMRESLRPEHVKRMLLGHWGTTPGQNFILAHLNRLVATHDLDLISISGPGHGGPAVVANAYLDGTYSDVYGDVSQDEAGLTKLFSQFSFPGGIPSHASPECPGSMHEGGELGYSLAHAFGAAFDNPDLIVACVIGDGEAETGPLAASWHSNKFLHPVRDGTVLPILHLNGYKISNPTVLARIPRSELDSLLRGYGWHPWFVEGDDPAVVHRAMAEVLEEILHGHPANSRSGRRRRTLERRRGRCWCWVTPKGWTGPRTVGSQRIEGTFRSHQVPLKAARSSPGNSPSSNGGCAVTDPKNCSTRRGPCCRTSAGWRRAASAAFQRIPMRTAVVCSSPCNCPPIAAHAVDIASPGLGRHRMHVPTG